MKIIIFNVKYSENLGDGLLATCLEDKIKAELPHAEVETIDLAGRTGFGPGSVGRKRALAILRRLPASARRQVVRLVLARRLARLSKAWDQKIAAADAVVIGGGNLLQDDDLNFPLKVGAVLQSVGRHKRPLAVYAIGVGNKWSKPAQELFSSLRRVPLRHCSVRDTLARDAFARHLPDLPAPKVVMDPGLCARQPKGQAAPTGSEMPRVGICVTDPTILIRHADISADRIPLTSQADLRTLIEELIDRRMEVSLFTNGAPEDDSEIHRLIQDPSLGLFMRQGYLRVCARPRRPEDLLGILGRMDVIVAHRLHASIAAFALGVPHIGLDWDSKVRGFFDATGRNDSCALAGTKPEAIANLVHRALKEGLNAKVVKRVVKQAENDIAALVSDLIRS